MAPKEASTLDCEQDDYPRETTISFTKEAYDTPVGIVIKSHPKRATIITSIKQYSLITDNDLVGMELVSFNGITLDGMSLKQTIGLFRRAIGTCKLYVVRRATEESILDKKYVFAEMATEETDTPAEKEEEQECAVYVSEKETELMYVYEESFVEMDDDDDGKRAASAAAVTDVAPVPAVNVASAIEEKEDREQNDEAIEMADVEDISCKQEETTFVSGNHEKKKAGDCEVASAPTLEVVEEEQDEGERAGKVYEQEKDELVLCEHTVITTTSEDGDDDKEGATAVSKKGTMAKKVKNTENENKSLSETTENMTDTSDIDDDGEVFDEDDELNKAAAVPSLEVAIFIQKIAEIEYEEVLVDSEDEFAFIDTVEC